MPQTTGSITNVNDAVSLSYLLDRAVYFTISGTYAGMKVQFQISKDGGTSWASLPVRTALPTATNTISQGSTFTLAANENRQFFADDIVVGTAVRVLLLATTSGTANVTIQTVAGTEGAGSPVNANRNGGVLHRSAIAAADKLATPTVGAATAVTEAGSTLPASALNYTAAAGNRWGPTVPAALQAITPTINQAVRFAITQVAGAVYYDIFLSTDAAPKWVGRITEAQRAAGGFIISTAGTVTAGGAAPAGSIDIGIVGTGLAWNVNPFAVNNAYTPATPTLINCAGFSRAHLHVKLAVTDLRSLPTLNVVPFFQDQVSNADWFQSALMAVSLLTAVGQCMEQDFEVDVDGATGLVVLVDTISGQGAACSIWVELVR